jgi:hypothetical protein
MRFSRVATGRITAAATGGLAPRFFFVGIARYNTPTISAHVYQSEQHATTDDLRRKAIACVELIGLATTLSDYSRREMKYAR